MIKIQELAKDKDIAHYQKTMVASRPYSNESEFSQVSELKEVFENLDKDIVEAEHFTSIDFNTRLTNFELSGIVGLQMLVPLKVGGANCSLIARNIKRHKVSLGGLGRMEKVQIVQGQRDHQSEKQSIGSKLMGLFGAGKKE